MLHFRPRLAIAVMTTMLLASTSAFAATPANTLVMAKNIDDMISLDPAEAYELSGIEVDANIYDRIVRIDAKDPTKIEQLRRVELEQMKTLRDFLKQLKETKEEGATLLDRTMVFFSSNLGDASTHAVKNMPIVFAGGGFKHGQHLAFDPKDPPPLSNLYVSMLHRLGIEADKFGSSTGTLTGLEAAG